MFSSGSIVANPAAVAVLFAVFVGAAAFWSNPKRATNRAFCSGSLHVAVWLLSVQLARSAEGGLVWLRWACAIGGAVPFHIWIVQQTITEDSNVFSKDWLRKQWLWALVTGVLVVIPFSEAFIPSHSTPEHRLRGWAFYAYIALDLVLYAYLARDALKRISTSGGMKRLELQVWLGGGTFIAVAILALMTLNGLTRNPDYVRLQPLILLLFYSVTAYAMTNHRIFDARQVVLLVVEKALLVIAVALSAYMVDAFVGTFIPSPFDFLVTTAIALWIAVALNSRLDQVFRFYPEATSARQAAFAAARRETKFENLEAAFVGILKGWGHSEQAVVISGTKGALRGNGVDIPEDSLMVAALRQLRWATPERLNRERSSPERRALAAFLHEHGIGAIVIAEGATLTVLVGVGISASRRPFTYPQVTQLMEFASIIENALERAHFSAKAQHAEQLATVGLMGASFAHEIRNPLVTIKTFVQLLPKHHSDPVFREKFFGLIGDEVNRIDRLTEQLLDLASPRSYRAEIIEIHPVLRSSVDLVAAKANDKRIRVLNSFDASPDVVFTDPSAAKQVLLNLCFNAIQAVEKCEGDRWVKICTRNVAKGVEMSVADSGPGIAPEIRPRLFQPFQTTKSSGFGLGLAICSDILTGLDATITVDSSVPGRGACFRVTFPCPA